MRYLFKHVLMRDAVYAMQMRRRLRELHRRAAAAMEELYAADLAPHYADLVYHHHCAENPDQERHYAALAGQAEAEAGSYQAAVHFLSRALELTPAQDVAGRYALLLTREHVHHVHGARKAQATDLAQLTTFARSVTQKVTAALRYSDYHNDVGDYQAALAVSEHARQ